MEWHLGAPLHSYDGGRDLPVGVRAVVHLNHCLLFGGFDGWSGSPVQRCCRKMEGPSRMGSCDEEMMMQRSGCCKSGQQAVSQNWNPLRDHIFLVFLVSIVVVVFFATFYIVVFNIIFYSHFFYISFGILKTF